MPLLSKELIRSLNEGWLKETLKSAEDPVDTAECKEEEDEEEEEDMIGW